MNKHISRWMIYGCYGYSGKLLAEEAARRGMTPVVAGRNEVKTRAVANDLGLPYCVVSLENQAQLEAALEGIDLVMHCAGPFSSTSAPMIDACMNTRTHYFDISGEIEVFEHAHTRVINDAAKAKGIIVCPGSGFDVIPTDCLAMSLADAMPDARTLTLGFSGFADLAPGTAKTMVEGMAKPVMARRDGEIINSSLRVREIDYGSGPQQSMTLSWGDVSTAYYTTGIPNIEVYTSATDKEVFSNRLAALFRPLFRLNTVQKYLKNRLGRKIVGPDTARRKNQRLKIWGEVSNAAGLRMHGYLETTSGYEVTITGPLAIVEYMMTAAELPAGSVTPSMLMGKDFVSRLPDCTEITIVEA